MHKMYKSCVKDKAREEDTTLMLYNLSSRTIINNCIAKSKYNNGCGEKPRKFTYLFIIFFEINVLVTYIHIFFMC